MMDRELIVVIASAAAFILSLSAFVISAVFARRTARKADGIYETLDRMIKGVKYQCETDKVKLDRLSCRVGKIEERFERRRASKGKPDVRKKIAEEAGVSRFDIINQRLGG